MRRISSAALIVTVALVFTVTAQADQDGKKVFGWVEKTTIESWDVEMKAKLDSGALTSSMQATDIENFTKDGEDWVRFTVDVEDADSGKKVERRYEKPLFRDLTVRGAGGKDERPVVLMKICMGDTVYEEQFSLRDRSEMLYPVLLGRRTIQHLGLLDVTSTFQNPPTCDDGSEVKHNKDQKDDEDIGD
tara:strand:+ start:3868 stop:4434 length:567 start_codon:yes stop_codon:yes gene_type:complete